MINQTNLTNSQPNKNLLLLEINNKNNSYDNNDLKFFHNQVNNDKNLLSGSKFVLNHQVNNDKNLFSGSKIQISPENPKNDQKNDNTFISIEIKSNHIENYNDNYKLNNDEKPNTVWPLNFPKNDEKSLNIWPSKSNLLTETLDLNGLIANLNSVSLEKLINIYLKFLI